MPVLTPTEPQLFLPLISLSRPILKGMQLLLQELKVPMGHAVCKWACVQVPEVAPLNPRRTRKPEHLSIIGIIVHLYRQAVISVLRRTESWKGSKTGWRDEGLYLWHTSRNYWKNSAHCVLCCSWIFQHEARNCNFNQMLKRTRNHVTLFMTNHSKQWSYLTTGQLDSRSKVAAWVLTFGRVKTFGREEERTFINDVPFAFHLNRYLF